MPRLAASVLLTVMFVSSLVARAEETHIVHCLAGCPTGAPSTNDLVVREIFALSSNDTTKLADWVAYRVTRTTIGVSDSLERSWKADPFLADNETLEKGDYAKAHSKYGYDKGHQAPLASFAGTVFWRVTNYLSNITPQKKGLNRGPWKDLESAVRDAAYHLRQLYVVTGPLYDKTEMQDLPEADEQHVVPTGYWKVIATKGGRITAFIFDQDTPRKAKYCARRARLSDIEARADLDLFPRKSAWPKGNLDTVLGC